MNQVCCRVMGGGNKKKMKEDSDRHFAGIKQIIPSAKRLVLFDYDDDDQAFTQKQMIRSNHYMNGDEKILRIIY
ncbi:MAG UNVERIFIED_CONTAM: hypothetical protein LVR29_09020 [Microcystis novacekii LVE1205-3]